MKFYNVYTKEPFSFLVKLHHQDKCVIKIIFSETMKTVDKKIKRSKSRYNLHRQTAEISVLSSRNVSKYEYLTENDVLPEKDFLKRLPQSKHFNIHH